MTDIQVPRRLSDSTISVDVSPDSTGDRVLIASRIYLPEPAAASFRLASLAAAVLRRGADVDVLTTTTREHVHPDQSAVKVHRFPVLRDSDGYVRGYLPYLTFDAPLVARLLLKRPRPDVVVCEPPPTTGAVVRLVCAVRHIPYVYYAGDVWADALQAVNAPAPVVRFASALERWAMNGAQSVMAVSPGVVDAVRRLGVITAITMVGNGVDTSVFTPDGDVEGDARTFVYTGTASEVHGALVLVDAFERLLETHPDARLVFVGQGTDIAAITERARQLPDGAIRVLPRRSGRDVARMIRGSAAALASVRPGPYDFAFPSKAYAAAACGTRVIMAASEATRAPIAAGGLGWAVDFDADQVSQAMAEALATPDTEADRRRRAAWVDENVSLTAAAARAADVVLSSAATVRP